MADPELSSDYPGYPVSMQGIGMIPPNGGMAPPPIPQVNPGLAAHSGAMAGLAGQATNPYLVQQQQLGMQQNHQNMGLLEQAQSQQMEAMRWASLRQQQQQQMQQQMQMHKERLELQKNQMAAQLGQHLLEHSESEEGRQVGARAVLGLLGATGNQAESLVKGIATRRFDPKNLNDVMTKMAEGYTDDMIIRNYPNIKPQDLQEARQAQQSPLTRSILKIPSPEDLQRQVVENKLKNIELVNAEYPELKQNYGPLALTIHRQLNHGQDYKDGTDDTRLLAASLAKKQLLDDEVKKQTELIAIQEGMRSRLQAERDIEAERRMYLKNDLDLQKLKAKEEEKRKQSVAVTKQFLNQFEGYFDQLDKGGFLPKDDGVYEDKRASVKQGHIMIPGVSQPNNEVWRGWLDLQGNMIGFARSVQNDIGPRAMAAFLQAQRVSEHPPTRKGLEKIAKQMREQLDAAERGDIRQEIGDAQYQGLIKKGYSPEQINQQYYVPGVK